MTTPRKWKKKLVLFELEGTYGTDATPTGSDAIMLKDVSLDPMMGNDLNRDLETPHLGHQGALPVDLHRKLSFKVELEGSGTVGTAPAWGKLLRACAVAETIAAGTSVTYNPVSDGHEAGTFYAYIDTTLFKLYGARGTATFEVSASGIPYINFTFTGLYSEPEEATVPTPDYSAFQKPRAASKSATPTFTIGGSSFVLRSFELDLGNEVEPRFLIGDERIVITDRSESLKTTVEAVPLTTFDPFGHAAAADELPIVLTHGTAAGKITTFSVPKAQMLRPDGLGNAQNIVEWPLAFMPVVGAGNDQWTLTLT